MDRIEKASIGIIMCLAAVASLSFFALSRELEGPNLISGILVGGVSLLIFAISVFCGWLDFSITVAEERKREKVFAAFNIFFILIAIFAAARVIFKIGDMELLNSYKFNYSALIILVLSIFGTAFCRKERKGLKKTEKEALDALCQICLNRGKISQEVPYCQECFDREIIGEIMKLTEEAEKRITLSEQLGLEKQAQGAKKWFFERLPRPIQEAVHQAVLSRLKEYLPEIKPFESGGFAWYPLDTDRVGLNIPSDGLSRLTILKKLTN